tara:strand:- start:84 stop:368 length:285 start_codon:yes stop_codon:yes gene_type:complete
MKKIRITHNYCYLKVNSTDKKIVQMWKIMGIPFTFDELPELVQELEDVKLDADTTMEYTMEDLFRASDYLIAEACHPVLFDMSDMIENYEEVPD